jgi:hypothetical protein
MLGKRERFCAAWISLGVLTVSLFVSGQEKKIARSRLPPMVEKTVERLAKNAAVRGFSQEIERGITYYEVELIVTGHHKDFLMDSAGNVVEIEEQVALDSLPASVQDGLQAMARRGKMLDVESITKHGKLVAYEAQVVKNGKRTEARVGPEGNPLNNQE